MGKEATLRKVNKKFYGDDAQGRPCWFVPGEVIDLAEMDWPNQVMLEKARYLARLEYGEEPVMGDDGRMWLSQELADRHPGSRPAGDRASSPSAADDDPGAASSEAGNEDDSTSQAEGEESADGSATADETEDVSGGEEEVESPPAYETSLIGGGWYHVLVDGEQKTQRPVRKGDLDEWVAENL